MLQRAAVSLLSRLPSAGVALALASGCGKPAPPPPAGQLVVRITDGAGGPLIAGRIGFFDGDRLIELGTRDLYGQTRQGAGACSMGDRAVGTANGVLVPYGEASLPIGGGCGVPLGRHRVIAWRGFEHEAWQGEVTVTAEHGARLELPLERVWRADDALVADLHVHAAPSNDSTVPPAWRVMGQLCAGIQVTALSNHGINGDLNGAIATLGLQRAIVSIASNEGSSAQAHVGVYPVPVDRAAARGGSVDEPTMAPWSREQILAWARAVPGAIVQVNHPRFRMYALFDSARWDGTRWPPPFPLEFDAVEVLNGHNAFNAPGDRRIDEVVRDFYTLVGHDAWVTAVGASDTHHLESVIDGVARTYVLLDDPRAADLAQGFDQAAFVAAIRGRRAVATTGPWLDVKVTDGGGGRAAGPGQTLEARSGRVRVAVTLHQASYVHADAIRVLVGGTVVRTEPVPDGARHHRFTVEVDVTDATWIGVDAGGDRPLPVWMTGTYQQDKHRPGATPFAIVNPIRIRVPA